MFQKRPIDSTAGAITDRFKERGRKERTARHTTVCPTPSTQQPGHVVKGKRTWPHAKGTSGNSFHEWLSVHGRSQVSGEMKAKKTGLTTTDDLY